MPDRNAELTILSRDADLLEKEIIAMNINGLRIVQCATQDNDIDTSKVHILLADPDLAVKVVEQCRHLQWCQSTWAGNKPLLQLAKRDYTLTGVRGIFGEKMREYVFAYLLHFSRDVDTFRALEHAPQEHRWMQPAPGTLNGSTLGILGAGSIASALLPVANAFGMRVVGLNSKGETQPGYDAMFASADKQAFAAQCQAVVNLLPDTSATANFIDEHVFSALPEGAVFINAGRGSAVDDAALLDALDNGTLRAAVLDVFRQEPLPASHPFWSHPKIWVSQHTAAISAADDVARVFAENLQRFLNAEPLHYQLDFERGY
ncbi:D-2-hydroxyacid dehydrogenase [Alteromonas sp. H39]|uniref:D-2-hydroxyacid dehydrogenase n=1 Tax=Alteromonas sp. H39 TaxID=3389876 RepID=UPI0039E1DA9B